MSIVNRVQGFLKESLAVEPDKARFLLAVSGGVDSMVLMQVMIELGYDFEVAHCNFSLRGNASDEDENLVKQYCSAHGIKCHVKKFDTISFVKENKTGIQEAARKLRYDWFDVLLGENQLQFLVTAHHRDDSIETFFINLLRGSGVKGLKGIPPKRDHIIRPMLYLSKKEIKSYALQAAVDFREDESNATDTYLRNYIRLKLIPSLHEVKPGIDKIILREMQYFAQADEFISHHLHNTLSKLLNGNDYGDWLRIKKSKLLQLPAYAFVLSEWLKAHGFNQADADDVVLGLQKTTTSCYFSSTHELRSDRTYLSLRKCKEGKGEVKVQINEDTHSISWPRKILIQTTTEIPLVYEDNFMLAQLDYSKLKFPLVVRKWHLGDYFYPLGMQKRKKLSDFFTDLKVDSVVKEDTYVLLSENQIVWVIGFRIDERYKIDNSTTEVFKMTIVDEGHG